MRFVAKIKETGRVSKTEETMNAQQFLWGIFGSTRVDVTGSSGNFRIGTFQIIMENGNMAD